MNNDKLKKSRMLIGIAALQISGGVLLILLFGLINLITGGIAVITGDGAGIPWIFITGAVIGAAVILRGVINYLRANNYRKVIKVTQGHDSISFDNMEKELVWNRKKLLRELSRQINGGYWPGAHLDITNEVFLVDYDYAPLKADYSSLTVDEKLDVTGALIRDLTTAASQLDDKDLREQVDRLGDTAKQIYKHVAEHPEKADSIHRFTGYFLPTTVGLLYKYIELQKQVAKTEDMTEAIAKIKEIMDTLEIVYAKHSDALNEEQSPDTEAENKMLQNISKM